MSCPAGRSVPGRGHRSAGGVHDQTGPDLGPCWVRSPPGPQGHKRSPTVTSSHEEPQVSGSSTHTARTTPGSGSDCGPESHTSNVRRLVRVSGAKSGSTGEDTALLSLSPLDSWNGAFRPRMETKGDVKFESPHRAAAPPSRLATRQWLPRTASPYGQGGADASAVPVIRAGRATNVPFTAVLNGSERTITDNHEPASNCALPRPRR
jgi:hypothetical protein